MATCSRCGGEARTYGSDGLSYCDSCSFYGLNSQCQKCMMYLPRTELQQYRGQWYCPYCIMDMRDTEAKLMRKEERAESARKEELTQTETLRKEYCSRCNRELFTAYFYQGRMLCESCFNDERDRGDPISPSPSPIKIVIRKEEEIPILTPIIKFADRGAFWLWELILRLFGFKPKKKYKGETKIVAIPKKIKDTKEEKEKKESSFKQFKKD